MRVNKAWIFAAALFGAASIAWAVVAIAGHNYWFVIPAIVTGGISGGCAGWAVD